MHRHTWDWKIIGIIFLIAWISLDLRWQTTLFRQLKDTYYLYAGKSLEEKHLAAKDGELFRFAQEIKKHLPLTSKRIFIATPIEKKYRWYRLRMAYHLLPHNVYSSGWRGGQNMPSIAVLNRANAGDYIVFLGPTATMYHYDTSRQILSRNLVGNGSFEKGKNAGGFCATCSDGDYEITTETAHTGHFSLKQIGPPTGEYQINLPGYYFRRAQKYTYSLWVKLLPGYQGRTDTLHGRIFYADNDRFSWGGAADQTNYDWQKLTKTFTTHADSEVLQVSLYVGYPTGIGTRYIDDLQMLYERPAKLIYSSKLGTIFQLTTPLDNHGVGSKNR